MAPSPRLLFPGAGNFTCIFANCSGECWEGVCINTFSPPPPLAPDSVPIAVQHKSKLLPSFLIASASLLVLSFLLLLLFYSLLRLRRRNRRRRAQQQHQAAAQHQPPHQDDVFLDGDGDQDDGAPHHVWFIRTVGLDESVIKSIAAVVYKSGDGLIDGGDCTVCLGEFSDGEVIKLLPKCDHAFHLSCIDTWLRSHVNCPLCRAPVVAPAVEAVGPTEEAGESVQIEVPPQENQEESAVAIDLTAGSSSSSGPLEVGDEVQPIRRSVSMDASSLARLMMRAEPESEEKLGEERKELELREVVISKNMGKGVDCCAEKQPAVELNRSLSSRSGRFFFSRYARGRSASVLPL